MATLMIEIKEGSGEAFGAFPLQYGQHISHESEVLLGVDLMQWDEPTFAQQLFLDTKSWVVRYWMEE
jgi:hypothetical protein